jgi:hypothetical protein
MDKNLANYLFHDETIYSEQVELTNLIANPKEVKTAPEPVAQRNKVPEKAIARIEDSAALDIIPELIPFKLKTPHLLVVDGIKPEEKDFLVKVLLALNMSLGKVDLLDRSQHPNPDFKEIIYNNTVRSILFLGTDSGGEFLPKLRLTSYQVKEIKQIKFLASATLNEVSLNQNNEKRQLWKSLKELYQ